MTTLGEKRSEEVFEDFKPPYTAAQAVAEANRCLFCEDAPCTRICPTHIDIAQFIRKIATGNLKGSAKTIFDSNILGMSCARVCPVEVLCVGDCVYNELGMPPIQIGKLQRYATDAAFDANWRYYEAGPDTGRSVGLVGGGPATLACAHELRRLGHACTIYESRQVLGGLNTYGVAPYKMKADRAVEEVEWVMAIGGIDVQLGVQIGQDITWEELEARHDALFIGMGLGPDRWLEEAGEGVGGVTGAVDFIEKMKLGEVAVDGTSRAVVIGGGNTAIDVVRELMGLGIGRVVMVYRGDEPGMSGYEHEWKAAKIAGAAASWHAQPVGFDVEGGALTGVRCVRLGADRQPEPGSEFTLEADLAVLAIGQSKLGDMVAHLDGIELSWGRVVVDEHGATGRAGVFAGGDCANGGKEVVNAVAEGKAAAAGIHTYLGGE